MRENLVRVVRYAITLNCGIWRCLSNSGSELRERERVSELDML